MSRRAPPSCQADAIKPTAFMQTTLTKTCDSSHTAGRWKVSVRLPTDVQPTMLSGKNLGSVPTQIS